MIGFLDTAVRLRSQGGSFQIVLTAELLADPTFRTADAAAGPEVPVRENVVTLSPGALLDGLPDTEIERVTELEGHLLEATTGYRSVTAQAEGADPHPDFHPDLPARQRIARKAKELGMTDRRLWDVLGAWRAEGLWALVDRRKHKVSNPLAGVDAKIIEAILDQHAAEIEDSTGTLDRFHRRVQNRLDAKHGAGAVRLPSRATFHRYTQLLLKGRHTFGASTTRRTTAQQPDRIFGHLIAHRPGEVVLMDSTPLDIRAWDPATDTTHGVELTVALDLATRSLLSWRITPEATKAVDVGLLLIDAMTPEPMRPGWADRLRYQMARIPLPRKLDYHQRLADGAARPVVFPETLIIDHGKQFDSDVVHRACTRLGINLQLGRKGKPTDKPQVEAVFATINNQFSKHVAGYKGNDVVHRGKNVEQAARWSIPDLEDLFAEYVVSVYQRRRHDGLIMPGFPDLRLSPNEAYSLAVARSGYVACPTDPELYYELLPIQWRTIQPYGVEYQYLTYDADILYRYRKSTSPYPGGKWPIRIDPRNVLHAYFQDPADGAWHVLRWTHAGSDHVPFTDVTLREAIRLVTARRGNPDNQDEVADALRELQNRTDAPETGPPPTGAGECGMPNAPAPSPATSTAPPRPPTRQAPPAWTASPRSRPSPTLMTIPTTRHPLGRTASTSETSAPSPSGHPATRRRKADMIHPGFSEPRTKEEWRAYLAAIEHSPRMPAMPTWAAYQAMDEAEREVFNEARDDYHSAFIILRTPPMDRIHAQITKKLKLNKGAPAGARPGIVIDGPPTVGKSTLVKTFAADYEMGLRRKFPERFDAAGPDYIPVVYISVPAGATPKMLSAAIAEYMNLELPRTGATSTEITTLVLKALRKCGTQLVIIDDIHFLDVSAKDGRLANDHLKNLANFCAATFVYTGVEVLKSGLFLEGRSPVDEPPAHTTAGTTEGPAGRATQTSGRFTLFQLDRFKIDTLTAAREWALVVKSMEEELGLFKHKPGYLDWEHLHDRTGGSINSLSILIREAALDAVATGSERITKKITNQIVLPRASEEFYRSKRKRRRNPPPPQSAEGEAEAI
ncbi:TniB family NTP-binding protein [Streptomyces diastaticus]|uniref:TniB family NTP-binding protein n=1 Tax=Streptomyces diastaticus TaxID=1956 RepID=UPI0033C22B55